MPLRFIIYFSVIYIAAAAVSYSFRSYANAQKDDPQHNISIAKIMDNIYSDYLWGTLKKTTEPGARFSIIKRILSGNPSYTQAYSELCNSRDDFILSGVRPFEIAGLVRAFPGLSENDSMLDCYIAVLKKSDGAQAAISYMEKLYNDISDPYRKGLYFEKIKALRNEYNILALTKAVDSYRKKYLSSPNDLSLLVETGIMDRIPEDPYGGQYFISGEGNLRSTSAKSQEGH